jgi:hypothetical protein
MRKSCTNFAKTYAGFCALKAALVAATCKNYANFQFNRKAVLIFGGKTYADFQLFSSIQDDIRQSCANFAEYFHIETCADIYTKANSAKLHLSAQAADNLHTYSTFCTHKPANLR